MNREHLKTFLVDTLFEIIGSILIAIGIYNFALSAQFPLTGFSGISMILYRLYNLPMGLTSFLMNLPLIFLCYKLLGKNFLFKSFRCILISSFFLDFVAPLFPIYTGPRGLAALCTGIFAGLGYSLIYIRNSSTGGADFLVMAIKAVHPHIEMGTITFLTDLLIVIIGGAIFKDWDGIIYGIVISYLLSFVINKVIEKTNSRKMALIVTTHGSLISDTIENTCHRGSTILNALGGYKKDDKQVVMVACNKKELLQIEKAIKEVDSDCFIILLDSNEVIGEGFHSVRIAESNSH